MFKNILLPTDGSTLSANAVEQGIALAKALNARVVGLNIVPEFSTGYEYRELALTTSSGYTTSGQAVAGLPPEPSSADEYRERIGAIAERFLEPIRSGSEAAGVACKCLHRVSDDPAAAIVDAAGEQGCDVIVMGSHGRGGIKSLVLGSQTNKVLTHSKVPVLVYR
ncbi:MAG: universal stress protein [Pirellulaceae bacterium]